MVMGLGICSLSLLGLIQARLSKRERRLFFVAFTTGLGLIIAGFLDLP